VAHDTSHDAAIRKGAFCNARERIIFACIATGAFALALHHLRNLTLTFFPRVIVVPEKCMHRGCLSPTVCLPGDAPALDDQN